MRSPMTPHLSDAPAVPSKSQEEEGICHGDAATDNEQLNASKLTGNTSTTDDCAIRHRAAPQKKESAKCTELVMHGVIQTIANSELGEAHIHGDDSTHAGSELGEAPSQNDDYIQSHSELTLAHIRDYDVIGPFGDSRGNYASQDCDHDTVMQSPFDNPWAGSVCSSSTSSSVMQGSIKTDDNDDPVQDNENYGNEFIQTIENNPETGAAATAKVLGPCPVLENAEAVSASAEAYRKADALVLAPFPTSSNAIRHPAFRTTIGQ